MLGEWISNKQEIRQVCMIAHWWFPEFVITLLVMLKIGCECGYTFVGDWSLWFIENIKIYNIDYCAIC